MAARKRCWLLSNGYFSTGNAVPWFINVGNDTHALACVRTCVHLVLLATQRGKHPLCVRRVVRLLHHLAPQIHHL